MPVAVAPVNPPNVTTTQRDALVAKNGDIVNNTTVGFLQRYNGTSWITLADSVSPLSSDLVVNAGIFVPKRGLDRFSVQPISGVKHVVILSDSISQETATFGFTQSGYLDGYVSRLSRSLGNAIGPNVGVGFVGLWRCGNTLSEFQTSAEITLAGGWAKRTAGHAENLVPFRSALHSAGATADIITLTPKAATASRVVADAVTRAFTTTVAAGGGVGSALSTFVGSTTINCVAATAGLASTGCFRLTDGTNIALVTYGGLGANSFTGCTWQTISGAGPSWTLAVGNTLDFKSILVSATAAFTSADQGSMIYGDNIPRNNHIAWVVSSTIAHMNQNATAGGTAQKLGITGRSGWSIAQVDVLYVDTTGTAVFSTSVNGGGSWQAGPAQTNPASPQLKKFTVTTSNPATFKVRAATAAAANAACTICGFIVYSTAAPTTGVMVHNVSRDGGCLDAAGPSTPDNNGALQGADGLRLLDNTGVSGNTGSIQPSLVVVLFSNDISTSDAQYTANLTTVLNRISGYCDMIVINPFEQFRFDGSSAAQISRRAAVKAWCVSNNVPYLDIYDAWVGEGITGVTAAATEGLMIQDLVPGTVMPHPSLEGHSDIAGHFMRMLSRLAV